MGGLTRRQLLKAGAGAGAAALAADPLLRSAMAMKLPPGELTDIEHMVILIQENRSFDHYFGMLPGVRGFADQASRASSNSRATRWKATKGCCCPSTPESGPGSGAAASRTSHTPGSPSTKAGTKARWTASCATHLAVDGEDAGPATMGYYEREDIPFYYALAETFTICDGYHCSVLGPDLP